MAMRFQNIMFHKLNKCPIDAIPIIRRGRRIKWKTRSVRLADVQTARYRALDIRADLQILISTFLDIVIKGCDLENKYDRALYNYIKKDFRFFLEQLDDIGGKEGLSKLTKNVNEGDIINYLNMIEGFVTGHIYYSLLDAANMETEPKKFFYALWQCIHRKSGMYVKFVDKQGSINADYKDLFTESEKEGQGQTEQPSKSPEEMEKIFKEISDYANKK